MKITTSLLQACHVAGDAGHELAVSVTKGLCVSWSQTDEQLGKVIPSPLPCSMPQGKNSGKSVFDRVGSTLKLGCGVGEAAGRRRGTGGTQCAQEESATPEWGEGRLGMARQHG